MFRFKNSVRNLAASAVALISVAFSSAPALAQAQTYDLAADWSITANPNGAWSYGRLDGSLSFFPFVLIEDAAYLGDFLGEQPAWDGGYPMVLGKSTGTSIHDFPLNRVGGHTYNDDNYMAVRWTAPAAGTCDISGGVWMFRQIGREGLISLYINGVALFSDVLIPARSAGYNSGATFSLGAAMTADGGAALDLLQVPLAAGDTVTLAVRKTAASPYGDFVGIDLTLVFKSGFNQPPVITCHDPIVLWSPNHELIDASSALSVDDPDGDPVEVSIRVFSDETEVPDTGDGTGRHAPDFKTELASSAQGLFVRSERRAHEDGRFYLVVITADDGNGGVTTAACVTAVCPHDQTQEALDAVLAQATGAAAAVQAEINNGTLPAPPYAPSGLNEHGISAPLGPIQ